MMEVWSFIISNVMNVFAMLDLWLIMRLLFGCDMKTTPRNLVWAASVFLIVFGGLTFFMEDDQAFTIFIGMCLYNVAVTVLLTKSHRLKTVFLTIPAVLVYSQFSSFVNLVEKLTGLERFTVAVTVNGSLSFTDIISDALLFAILVWLGKTKIAKSKSIQLTVGEGILISVFCVFSPMIVIGLEWFEGQNNNILFSITWILFMIILNVAVVYAIAHRKKATYYKQLSEGYKREFEAEYSFFKDYKEQQQDTIKFRHDWKNHMMLLQEMMKNEEYAKAENYFKDLTASTPQSVHKIATGHELVDMILSTKMNRLEELEIALKCQGDFSKFHFMKHVDCCILLSNLLDNAIEANEKNEGKRYISLFAKNTEGVFYLEIRNPMCGELRIQDEKILSTKLDTKYHGIGLQNVQDIIKQYQGDYKITTKGDEYIIQMMFSM